MLAATRTNTHHGGELRSTICAAPVRISATLTSTTPAALQRIVSWLAWPSFARLVRTNAARPLCSCTETNYSDVTDPLTAVVETPTNMAERRGVLSRALASAGRGRWQLYRRHGAALTFTAAPRNEASKPLSPSYFLAREAAAVRAQLPLHA